MVVLEKHADFLRDFRGDTIHPSTLEVMDELGLLDDLLKLPHNKVAQLQVTIGDTPVTIADFTFLPPRHAFIALMPQWDFLDFLADRARRYPQLQADHAGRRRRPHRGGRPRRRRARDDARRTARGARTPDRRLRRPHARSCAPRPGLEVEDIGAPIDVFWMRISRRPGDPPTGGRIDAGSFFAVLDRGDYFQLAYVIPKGDAERIMQAGLPAFRADASPRRCRSSPTASTS